MSNWLEQMNLWGCIIATINLLPAIVLVLVVWPPTVISVGLLLLGALLLDWWTNSILSKY